MRQEKPLEELELSSGMLNRLIGIVKLLPDETRHVFTLRKVCQLGHREIATRMGISEERVAECLVNAIQYIDSQLSELECSEVSTPVTTFFRD